MGEKTPRQVEPVCPITDLMQEEKNGLKMDPQVQSQKPKDTRFQPGHPGGPGRPKGSVGIKRLIREALWKDGGQTVDKIVESVMIRAKYDLAYLRFILATLDETESSELPNSRTPEPG